MSFTSAKFLYLVLTGINLVIAAPLNDLSLAPRDLHDNGWKCHYDGPSTLGVDTTIDLPGVVASLCLKVNYDYPGCEDFRPYNPRSTVPVLRHPHHTGRCPQGDPEKCNSTNPSDSGPDGEVSIESIDHPEVKHHRSHPKKKRPLSGKHRNPTSPEDDSDPVNTQAFNSNDPNDMNSDGKEDAPKKPQKSQNKLVPNNPNHSMDPGMNQKCAKNQFYCSNVKQCVNKNNFFAPNQDGRCDRGEKDALLNLCLDVSLLKRSGTDVLSPISINLYDDSKRVPMNKCTKKYQQWSSVLSACVDLNLLSRPSSPNYCEKKRRYDSVLGLCVDVSAHILHLVDAKANIDL